MTSITCQLSDPQRLLGLFRQDYFFGNNYYARAKERLIQYLATGGLPTFTLADVSGYGAILWFDTGHLDGQPPTQFCKRKMRWQELRWAGFRWPGYPTLPT